MQKRYILPASSKERRPILGKFKMSLCLTVGWGCFLRDGIAIWNGCLLSVPEIDRKEKLSGQETCFLPEEGILIYSIRRL